jgi:glucokinase-like ROK family protein
VNKVTNTSPGRRIRRGNRELIKEINRKLVLNLINNSGSISRIDLAGLSGLSAATITGITSELISDGLIFEKEEGDSRGGRKPILLALNPRGGYMVGIKLTEEYVIGALTDLKATVIANHTIPLNDRSLSAAMDAMIEVIKTLVGEGGFAEEKLLGIGVGLAGIVHADQGALLYSPIFGWRNVPLRRMLQDRLGVPVYVDNDVNTLTLTEKWFGAGQGVDHFLTVTIGRGIGLGIIVNGQLYHGALGGAGEFGHTVIDPRGPSCACGKKGCLETYASDPALVRLAAEAVERGEMKSKVDTAEDLLQRAEEGDVVAQRIFRQAGEVLGIGVANLITLFSPNLIIISGEGVRAGDWLFKPMRSSIERNAMPSLSEATEIRIDAWDDDAWARGAASLVLKELFETPMHSEAVESIT